MAEIMDSNKTYFGESNFSLEENQRKIRNKAIVTFKDGVVRDERARVMRSDGSEVWAVFPAIEYRHSFLCK